jgi:alpha-beta hydrolase superfamily lysophospholipase
MNGETLVSSDGIRIFLRSWRPAGRARAAIVLVHGFKSHGGYHEWTATQLVSRGLAVYAPDLRGHGRSEGERLYVGTFRDYVNDVAMVVSAAKSRDPGVPVVVLGHSAGGVISCLYVLDHPREVSGLISESFAHELPAPDFALAVLKGIGKIAPHAHVLSLKAEDFSRDPKVVERMKTDSLIPDFGYPAHTIGELVRADERLKAEFRFVKLPLLILHGTEDRAAKLHGSQTFYDAATSADKTLKVYEGAYHDLLNDVGREEVLGDIIAWLVKRLPEVTDKGNV